MEENKRTELNFIAAKARRSALEMVYRAHSGHLGGSFSLCEILSVLYFDTMKIDPSAPSDPNRDRFVLSKGHCTPALYSILAMRGYFPEALLSTFRDIDSPLSGHAEMRHVPGVDMSTGSLGQGISAAVGMALAAKVDKKEYRVYAVLGDGELEEGQVWEAAMAAGHYGLDQLCVFVDNNNIQIDGTLEQIMSPYPIDKKFAAFGWNVEYCDGHNVESIHEALQKAKVVQGKPTVIIATTVKGKGVSFMEDTNEWHGNDPDADQYAVAAQELDALVQKASREVQANE
uniref:transketolase n=1 Tax=Ndongobacter massiliensis TaxID=1871025 RepID=UPI000930DE1A|nr:transketolase [Ndongobacter massiliensis]